MSVDEQGQAEGRSRGAVWTWLFWIGVLLLVYVLSFGPVMRLWLNGHLREPNTVDIIGVVYCPVRLAYERTLLHKPLGLYFHLWAPQVYGSNGEPDFRM